MVRIRAPRHIRFATHLSVRLPPQECGNFEIAVFVIGEQIFGGTSGTGATFPDVA